MITGEKELSGKKKMLDRGTHDSAPVGDRI